MAWRARPGSQEKHREAQRRWQQSEQGRATKAKHDRSDHKRQMMAEYRATPDGREALKRAQRSPKGRARYARYYHARRMAMGGPSTLTAAEWEAIKTEQGYRCRYCDQLAPLTMDHVIPVSKGGTHTRENVVAACKPCNSRKRDRLIWPPLQGTTENAGERSTAA
jgi:5-methylcytosine-specific restriction endonuclease McrA